MLEWALDEQALLESSGPHQQRIKLIDDTGLPESG